ncbi:hypothetical protein CLIB1423_19S01992 [[Candida] railenensis]|uniref:Uncharacterized protein n=1 Tax=[Candida] railenensis TaxID=45579 RepID=A0A9P0W0C7_9ASCO|nr:hypothetical protein CLIB1423_19S01992 [[Candida] railenensis]
MEKTTALGPPSRRLRHGTSLITVPYKLSCKFSCKFSVQVVDVPIFNIYQLCYPMVISTTMLPCGTLFEPPMLQCALSTNLLSYKSVLSTNLLSCTLAYSLHHYSAWPHLQPAPAPAPSLPHSKVHTLSENCRLSLNTGLSRGSRCSTYNVSLETSLRKKFPLAPHCRGTIGKIKGKIRQSPVVPH